MRVRDATREDVPALRTVHEAAIRELGPDGYDDDQIDAWASGVQSATYDVIDNPAFEFVVAEDETVVGFGSLRREPPNGYEADVDGEVTGVYVHPDHAGDGVGTTLLRELETSARDADLASLGLHASLNAVAFYDARGYDRVTTHSHEFSTHEDTGVSGTVVEMVKRVD